jgi:Ni/Co efflux regulator RcnB
VPNAQYRQVRFVHRKQVLEQRRMPRLACMLRCSVRVDLSNQHAQPCLFDKSLHVLRRNGRHRELLPNAQYRQVHFVHRKHVLEQRQQVPCLARRVLGRGWRVPVYFAEHYSKPCLFDENVHVQRRHWRHGHILPQSWRRDLYFVSDRLFLVGKGNLHALFPRKVLVARREYKQGL